MADPALSLAVELRIDTEPFSVRAAQGRVTVKAGPCADAEVVIAADYESMVDVTDGILPPEEFAKRIKLEGSNARAIEAAVQLLGSAVGKILEDAPSRVPPRREARRAAAAAGAKKKPERRRAPRGK